MTGEILKFGDELRMNLKAHHCVSGAFLGGESAGGARLADLEGGVAAASGRLFAKVRAHAGAGEGAEGRVGDGGHRGLVAAGGLRDGGDLRVRPCRARS